MKHSTRYHPILAFLHWILAVLLIAALVFGWFVLAPMANTDPSKLDALRLHMAGGMLIGGLMLIRLITRLMTGKPAPLGIRERTQSAVRIAHLVFYVVVFSIVATGFLTAQLAHLPEIVFAGSGGPLPPTFASYWTSHLHRYTSLLLVALIVPHVVVATYHHYLLKDGLLRRMLLAGVRRHPPVEFGQIETTLS